MPEMPQMADGTIGPAGLVLVGPILVMNLDRSYPAELALARALVTAAANLSPARLHELLAEGEAQFSGHTEEAARIGWQTDKRILHAILNLRDETEMLLGEISGG